MSTKNKRLLGISAVLIIAGIFKISTKGIYIDGEFSILRFLAPFGLGILFLIYTLVMIYLEKKNNDK